MVVATALPNATSVRIVPWIRSSQRRNMALLEVGRGVIQAFIAIFLRRLTCNISCGAGRRRLHAVVSRSVHAIASMGRRGHPSSIQPQNVAETRQPFLRPQLRGQSDR
jgi:hypothetical protein